MVCAGFSPSRPHPVGVLWAEQSGAPGYTQRVYRIRGTSGVGAWCRARVGSGSDLSIGLLRVGAVCASGEGVLSPRPAGWVEGGRPVVPMRGLPKEMPTGVGADREGVFLRLANALVIEVGASLGNRKADARFSLRTPEAHAKGEDNVGSRACSWTGDTPGSTRDTETAGLVAPADLRSTSSRGSPPLRDACVSRRTRHQRVGRPERIRDVPRLLQGIADEALNGKRPAQGWPGYAKETTVEVIQRRLLQGSFRLRRSGLPASQGNVEHRP